MSAKPCRACGKLSWRPYCLPCIKVQNAVCDRIDTPSDAPCICDGDYIVCLEHAAHPSARVLRKKSTQHHEEEAA